MVEYGTKIGDWQNSNSICRGKRCCDVTWIPFENKWYTFIPAQGNGYKMEKAQEVCKDIGANVVSIHCEKENKFIVHQLKKNVQSETIWLGMVFDIDSDTLTWLDQSAVNYSNWGAGEPAGRFDADICIVMDTKSGQWKTVNCDNDSGRSVMCETTALAIPDREKCTKHGKNLLPTVLVIAFAVILVMISIVSWYAYKKKYLTVNGFTSLLSNTTDRVTNNSVLVENEEREYEA
ncbi:CD302 antigen-like isoform X2 [Narcine bancroftii]|uniref:CD302 antigen-like isoform X2 n=1 Tax=Narcine bancroftii TaxID=1343680 RepID=UPI003832111C